MNAMIDIDLTQQQSQVARYNPSEVVEGIVYRNLRSVKASLSARGKRSTTGLMASKVLDDLASRLESERKAILENVQDCKFMNFPIEAQLLANEIGAIRECLNGVCINGAKTMLQNIKEHNTVRVPISHVDVPQARDAAFSFSSV